MLPTTTLQLQVKIQYHKFNKYSLKEKKIPNFRTEESKEMK